MYRAIAIALATLICLSRPSPRRRPTRWCGRTTDEVLAIIKADKELQSGNNRKIVELAEAKVLPHFDFTRMTRLAVGRSWAQATDAQKKALTKDSARCSCARIRLARPISQTRRSM
jgi:phospholipid transport system substrate-binding protein